MPLIHTIDNAREERIGENGAANAALRRALERAEGALEWLRARHADGKLPLLRLPEKKDDLNPLGQVARKLASGASDVVLLGTGGSSLGGQTLAQLADVGVPGVGALRAPPRLHFMDNLDAATFGALLQKLPLKTARFVAISKSGGTGETLMQTIAVLSALEAAGLKASEHLLGLSEPPAGKKNGLRDLLAKHEVAVLDHDPGVGGRFSVLSNVGLLPAAVLGLDIAAVRAGAAAALAPVLAKKSAGEVPPAVAASLSAALAEKGKTIAVMMPYADRLSFFSRWFVQLWAESLGKNGKGTTPIGALGPVDQHSQLQLYLAGPADKFFTIVTTGNAGGPRIDAALAKLAGEPDLADKTIGDLVSAQGRATADTLARNGRPTRTIHIPKLDEAALGELLMHFMLETIVAAHLLGVDAFDQPAVEEGKLLAKKYLAGGQ